MPIAYPFDGQYDGIENRIGVGMSASIPGFFASAYDGTNDYQVRGSDLDGNVDSKKYLMSVFVQLDGVETGNVTHTFLASPVGFIRFFRDNLERARIQLPAVSLVTILDQTGLVDTVTPDMQWHHIIASGDMAAGVGSAKLFVDGVDETNTIAFSNQLIDFTQSDYGIGARPNDGGQKLHGKLSEFYINFAENLDLTVLANIEKFRAPNGRPAFLGDNGELPTGNSPIIYAPTGDATTNLGTGGNFTTIGSLDLVAGPGA